MKLIHQKSLAYLFLTLLFISPGIISAQSEEKPTNVSVPIFTYHRIIPKAISIYDFTPTMLTKQFRFLKQNGFHPITAFQFMEFQKQPELFPVKPVVLTFDDGNKSHYLHVLPLLKKFGFKATFFVYPNAIVKKSKRLLTWNELLEMDRAGMDIQSHTKSHPFLISTRPIKDQAIYLKWLEVELKGSKAILEEKLQHKVDLLAYPFGWYNYVVEEKAFISGYRGIFTVNWGVNPVNQNPYRMKRWVLSNRMSLTELERFLNSQPLNAEVISPLDGSIVTQKPVIKFKIPQKKFTRVELLNGKSNILLKCDSQGIFSFSGNIKLKPGFRMLIVRHTAADGTVYMDSWGFQYLPGKK